MRDRLVWGASLALGLAYALWLMPLGAIDGTGAMWHPVRGDNAATLALHYAFQNDAWRLPPLYVANVFWPHGVAVSIGDVNPLFSVIAKLIITATGGPAINLLGVWWFLCWVAMAPACVFALRQLGVRDVGAQLTAAALGLMTPALLARLMHINLFGHCFILVTLGLCFRMVQRPQARATRGDWALALAVLLLAIFTHPYIYLICAALLGGPLLQRWLTLRRVPWPDFGRALAVAVAPVALLTLASGDLAGGDKGFGRFSMNLLSLIWPQRSGLFGADLPVLDATGGQYEGFDYLGFGVLLLLAAWLLTRRWRAPLGVWRGMVAILAALFVLAAGSRMFAGHWLLLDLGLRPWESVFAVFRANGRAVWPVGYALMLAAVAGVSRLRPRVAGVLFGLALVLQWTDTGPLREAAREFYATPDRLVNLPKLPQGARLVSTAPAPSCSTSLKGQTDAVPLLLEAARRNLLLGDAALGRSPKWFNCEKFLSNGLEAPMRPGEVRAITDLADVTQLRVGVFGNAQCRRTHGMVLCGADVGPIAGEAVPLAGPDDVATLGPGGAPLPRLLGFGWKQDGQGGIWSEGPRSTLFLRPVLAGEAGVLRLTLTGIGFAQGEPRDVAISVNGGAPMRAALPDLARTVVEVPLRRAALIGGVAWVVFDVMRPVDPARRSLAAPVSRAALRLEGAAID
jgi:hypothetical protein